jgi:hypothetical protein
MDDKHILYVVAGFSAALTAYLIWPGFIYADAFAQLQEAISGTLTDWHPPIMSALWRLLLWISGGNPTSLVAFNITLATLGLIILLKDYHYKITIPVFLVVYFCPVFFGLLGVAWKDVSLAASVLLAGSIILNAARQDRRLSWFELAVVVVLLVYSTFLRSNAPILTAPLLLAAIFGWRKFWISGPISAIMAIALLIVSPWVNNGLLGARESKAIVSLQVFDLAGISHFSGANVVPGKWSENESQQIVANCYTPEHWDVYAWGRCSFVGQKVDRGGLTQSWLTAIEAYPLEYAQHRMAHLNSLLRYAGPLSAKNYFANISPGLQSDPVQREAKVYGHYAYLMRTNPAQPWHLPFIWLAIAVGFFVATIPAANTSQKAVNAVSFAAVGYLLAYVLVGVASDFRYALPPAYLITTVSLFTILERGIGIERRSAIIGGLTAAILIVIGVLI